jgi:transcriptional regulator of arginine metabolism
MTKTQRQHRIAQLLTTTSVVSQAQLVGLLRADGIIATQATVSRDLVELGAVKVRGSDGRRSLALPAASLPGPSAPDHLRRVLTEWVVDVSSAGPLVVVKTPPGCAHVVASALDRGVLDSVLGTVAGDDTIFVVVDQAVGGDTVAAQVRAIAGLPAHAAPSGRPRRHAPATKKGK